jgi:hypothetical protein
MRSIRQQLLRLFQLHALAGEPVDQLAAAAYAMLWSIDELDVSVDGWALFHVVRESESSLEAVGLMTLLPSGSVPIGIDVRTDDVSLAWSVQVGCQDQSWLALSASKRWNSVYLYGSGDREKPQWAWGRQYHGVVRYADA